MNAKRKAESHSRATNRPRIMKSGVSRADSERDSGFSDASSEHMSTMGTKDAEDSPRPQLAMVGGSYSNLSPMIIMNNVLLKQPGDNPAPALKPWGYSRTVEVVQPVVQQPQVVFIQPVVSRQGSPASKETSSRHKRPKKYLPILKSYPKIAPHPGDGSSSSGRGTASSSSSCSSSSSSTASYSSSSSTASYSSSSSTASYSSSSTASYSSLSSVSGSEKGCSLTSSHRDRCQREKQKRSICAAGSGSGSGGAAKSSLPVTPSSASPLLQSRLSLPTIESSSSSSPASSTASQSEFTPSLSFTHATSSKNPPPPAPQALPVQNSSSEGFHDNDSDADMKRKRFCNTYNILNKSGLLDITLRTKELLRQNRCTQMDLDQLKEHTELFLQALQSSDTSIIIKLQASLQEKDREKEKERCSDHLKGRLT